MRKVVAIAGTSVKRMFRDRSNLFFVFIFPLVLVLFIGMQFGGDPSQVVAVVGAHGAQAQVIVAAIDEADQLTTRTFTDEDSLVRAVERGTVQAAVIFPATYETDVEAGRPVSVGYIARNDGFGPQLEAVVGSVIDRSTAPVSAAVFVADQTDIGYEEALSVATGLHDAVPVLAVRAETTGESIFPTSMGQFDFGASTQLVLFMFLTGMTASAALIQSRRLGVETRMLSTPTSMTTIIFGEALGRFAVVVVQGIYIIVATVLIFQVDFGDPIGALAVLIGFSGVGAGAGLLVGAIFEDDGPAAGISIVLALGLAALGGSMMPAEFFSDTLLVVARFTPHFWANDAFAVLVREGGTVVDILPQLGMLVLFAVGLLLVASWRLRVALTH